MAEPPFSLTNYILTKSKVEGIEVYMPAPVQVEDQREVVEFNCPQCGATTAYNVPDGGLTCSYCGFYEPPKARLVGRQAEKFEFTVETMENAARGWGQARKEIECQNCGARTSLPPGELTHTCSFCGSNQVIQREAAQDALRPRFLTPFKIPVEECHKIARNWLGSSWMTPAALKQMTDLQAFKGIFLPYWIFDATTQAGWKAEVGHTETEQYYDHASKEWKTRLKTVWRWENGNVQLCIESLLVSGTQQLSAFHLGNIQKYDLRQLVTYEPDFLAGFQAQAYDVPLETAWESGRQVMREQTRQACRNQASTSQIRNFSMELDFRDESWRYVLLPIYVAAYGYQGKIYQVLVNGQNGTISGPRPVDWQKTWLVAGLLLVPGLLLGILGLVTLPLAGVGAVIGGVGFLLLVVGLVIAIILLVKASKMDDA